MGAVDAIMPTSSREEEKAAEKELQEPSALRTVETKSMVGFMVWGWGSGFWGHCPSAPLACAAAPCCRGCGLRATVPHTAARSLATGASPRDALLVVYALHISAGIGNPPGSKALPAGAVSDFVPSRTGSPR